MIEAGARAPAFTLSNQDGYQVALSDFDGRWVVLAFYPADFSPVCTDQLSDYEAVKGLFAAKGAEVLAISVDGMFCHKAFREKLGVSMPLLADFHPKGEVAKAYGAWSEEYGTSGRALVIVDPDGNVAWTHESPALEIPGAELILSALERLQAA